MMKKLFLTFVLFLSFLIGNTQLVLSSIDSHHAVSIDKDCIYVYTKTPPKSNAIDVFYGEAVSIRYLRNIPVKTFSEGFRIDNKMYVKALSAILKHSKPYTVLIYDAGDRILFPVYGNPKAKILYNNKQ